MRNRTTFKCLFRFMLMLLLWGSSLAVSGQDAIKSIKINLLNLKLSGDQSTISYDVYFQDIDPVYPVAIPGFVMRLAVPVSDLDTTAKVATVINASPELGANTISMYISEGNWIMKFLNANLILNYEQSLKASETYPGTRIGTFVIKNANGARFKDPQTFHFTFAGTSPKYKTYVSAFVPNTLTLAANSTTAMPEAQFSGFGTYDLLADRQAISISAPQVLKTKTYDGTDSAVVIPGKTSGTSPEDADSIKVRAIARYNDSKAGDSKTIFVSYLVEGPYWWKYRINRKDTVSGGSIYKRLLTMEGIKPLSKTYDGNTDIAIADSGYLTNVVHGDTVIPLLHAKFETPSSGKNKNIKFEYSISGKDAINYTAPESSVVTYGEILPKPLTISAPVIHLNKLYNGTSQAQILQVGELSGLIAGDNALVKATASYDNANYGTGKTITVSYELEGTSKDNYQAPEPYLSNNGSIDRLFVVKAFPEGLWDKKTEKLRKSLDWDKKTEQLFEAFSGDIADTLTVVLRDESYKKVLHSLNGLTLHQDGTITLPDSNFILLPDSLKSHCYITIQSRNHIETSSRLPVDLNVNELRYDFTTSAEQAFQVSKEYYPMKNIDGKWFLYAGDILKVPEKSEINSEDYETIFKEKSSASDSFGMARSDLNGDGCTDETDTYMAYKNAGLFFYMVDM